MSEFEFGHFRESLKNKDSILKHLLKVAGDVQYPVDIRRAALRLRSIFDKLSHEEFSKKGSVIHASIHEEITYIRQKLLAYDLGGSELSQALAAIQQNMRT